MKCTLPATLLTCLLLTSCAAIEAVANIEEPPYKVVRQDGDFEVREYGTMIVAEALVPGSLDDASGRGFRLLADYIFGNNIAAAPGTSKGQNEKIAMTAPVMMTPSDASGSGKAASEKIAMTAPVTMASENLPSGNAGGNNWRMHFVMPSQYTMATLPKPVNPAVKLRELPARRVAVIRFSGFSGDAKVAEKTADLKAWVTRSGLKSNDAPQLARYNAPWTPPPFRRNEVMVALIGD
jgi:hypothetical protein